MSGHDDIFEDAILEHLRDVRDEEEAENVYYRDVQDGHGEYDDESEPDLSKDQLLRVLDVIKREAQKRRERLSLQQQVEEVKSTTTEVPTTTTTTKKAHEQDLKKEIKVHKTVNKKNLKKEVVIQKQKRGENNQVASVEVDSSSLDKENELVDNTNLREILSKDSSSGGVSQTTGSPPKHAHIKQQNIVSTKENKAGLDQVSFIGK